MVTPNLSRRVRSNTHPLREHRGEPVDPNELYRRLKIQECRQKERASRRVRERHSSGQYHHTPQVAALDFQRTATQEVRGRKEVRKSSRTLVDRYKNNHGIRPRRPDATPAIRLPGILTVKNSEIDPVANRNQLQRTRGLETTAGTDKERSVDKGQQKGFNITFDRISSPSSRKKRTSRDRPYSAGDLDHRLSLDISPNTQRQPFDRPDWTQGDECHGQKLDSQPSKECKSLSLKGVESVRPGEHRNLGRCSQNNPRKTNFHWPLSCLGM
ncbi:hypothetical protein FGG08_001052 [Glutinoglossum americanum]|uniref:Uncharacterized protein n=1 Tax=Glutinoglossum americanum TaxID=1670608 RepID=A0A9P8IHE2_9PEZI|nr:hypothetical protein FGG08_001052 [Glutinoglossum americanum]